MKTNLSLLTLLTSLTCAAEIAPVSISGWTVQVTGGSYFPNFPFGPLDNPFLSWTIGAHPSGAFLFQPQTDSILQHFTGPDGLDYAWATTPGPTTRLFQNFDVLPGTVISGVASFGCEDAPPVGGDKAWIDIDGQSVWQLTVPDIRPPGESGDMVVSDYQSWSWTSPLAGSVELGLNLFGDGEGNAQADFWILSIVHANSVPDGGSTFAMLLLALCALPFVKRP